MRIEDRMKRESFTIKLTWIQILDLNFELDSKPGFKSFV